MRVGKRSSPIQSGRAPTWAGAVVYALGQVNFLFDSDTKPYATADDLSAAFGVAKSTLSAKAKQVRGHHNHTFGTNFCRHQLEIGVSGNWTIRLLQ